MAHFAWIDAIQSTPTPRLCTTLMILVSFDALVVALTGLNRIIMGMTFVLFTYGWMLSQLDSWQHHYFISLILGLSLFLPNVSAEQAADRSDPSQPDSGQPATLPAWALVLIAAQVAILYFWATIAKIDPNWFSGFVLADVSSDADLDVSRRAAMIVTRLGQHTWSILAVGTIIAEFLLTAAYLLAPWRDRTDNISLAAFIWIGFLTAVGLHGGIEFIGLGSLGLFSYYMIALGAVFLLPSRLLRPLASCYSFAGCRLAPMLDTEGRPGRLAVWTVAAIVITVALPLLTHTLDLPDSKLGAALAGAILIALAFRKLRPAAPVIEPAFVVTGLSFAVLIGATLLLTNVRAAIYTRKANLELHTANYDSAVRHFKLAESYRRFTGPADATAHSNLGVVFEKQGKLALATAQYERALKINPDDAVAHNNLGVVFGKQGNLVQAAAQYERAIQIDPAHADAHINLAIHLTNARSYTEALKHYRKVLELRPDHAWAYHDRSMVSLANNLAWILAAHPDAKIRNGAEAIRHAKAAVAATGGDEPGFLDTLAAAYAEVGKFSEAVKTAQRALAGATAKKQVDLAEQIESRLKIYQRGEPYRSE